MTSAQYLGYIPGSFARAQTLHLHLISTLASENLPRNVLSSEDWVFSKAYFYDSIPLSTYCSVIKLGHVGTGLRELLDSEGGERIRIHEAPADIRTNLGAHSLGMKSRLFKLLSLLVDLGCLIPVKPRTTTDLQRTGYANEAKEGVEWNYFRLAKSVPIYRFGDKDQACFCYNHAIQDLTTATSFWTQLRIASDHSTCLTISAGDGPPHDANSKLARSIRRKASWEFDYVLSSAQIEYLNSLIDPIVGHTPLDDLESTRFDNACFVTTAPASVVSEHFTLKRAAIQEGAKQRLSEVEREEAERRRTQEESRKALAAKAAKAKSDQESRWETIISKALDGRAPSHPQLQKGLLSLKSSFMVSSRSGSNKTWEVKVREVVRDSIGAKQFVIPPRSSVQPFKPTEEPNNEVTTLIRRQGQPIAQKEIAPKKSGRKSKKEIAEAEAEIETVVQAGGDSLKDFDLPAYITFLRQHVDKASLRAGAETTKAFRPESSFILQGLELLHANYIVNGKPSGLTFKQPTNWDFCFDIASEEPREREFLQHPFVLYEHDPETHPIFNVSVAQASIKMIMSTPDSYYDSNHAATLLSSFEETTIQAAVEGLSESLDPRRVRADKREPGRKYAYSDLDIQRLKGDFASSVYPDAAAFRDNLECLQEEEWMDVDLTGEDGEVAAYLLLVSNNMIDISIDTEIPRTGRRHIGWQSKKVDDENLEAHISVRLKSKRTLSAPAQKTLLSSEASNLEDLLDPVLARDPFNQKGCDHYEEIPSDGSLIEVINNRGSDGLPVAEAMDQYQLKSPATLTAFTKAIPPHAYMLGYDQARIVSIQHLSEWAVEVANTDETSRTESKLTFPRRWLDIYGNTLEDVWTMQELNDILTQLLLSGKVRRISKSPFPIGMTQLEDEKSIYWSLFDSANWF
ncbi:unnamed protein product [Rhizoctonia solani]|uniref:Transcription factor tau subunit sfc3/Tfc3 C-terminal domain-containing protein n=1 Tax=Rhizoctonia solani TaxID=456999 RepID=A0A8H2WBT2_9AGAM|nr:unnamed protein product [Rhizoctonia solani]